MAGDAMRVGGAGAAFPTLPAMGKAPFRLVLASFVCTYSLVQVAVGLSLAGAQQLLPVSLLMMVLLTAGVFVGSLLDGRRTSQQFYLVLCVLPGLTIARLAFTAGAFSAFDPLFVYLLLAMTLLVYRQTTGARAVVSRGFSGHFLRTFILAALLAATFVWLALQLGPLGGPEVEGLPWLSLVIVAPVALLDELWFRGILQGQLAAATSPGAAFLATLVLFVAYGAPFGGLSVLAFRVAFGLVFGFVAIGRRNLPIVLLARTLMAVALVLLVHAALGTSVVV